MTKEQYIMRCFDLAEKAKGYTAPNPLVGAVLVYNGHVIGEGWHQQYGEAHAEVNCLNSVRAEDKHLIEQSTMYVNLEPCAHHGNTPPCAHRLVKEKVQKVVVANTDPNIAVAGKGIAILRDAGIEVVMDVLKDTGNWLNRRFFSFHTQKRPYVILKWAQSAEGYIAPMDRLPHQLSNEHSQLLVHQWRTEEAAIWVGKTTAINDNPQLTARLWQGKQPLRIAFDKKLEIPETHHLYNADATTWIINEHKDEVEGNIRYVKMTFDDTILQQTSEALYRANILSVIIEGGATLLNSFIAQGVWDEARIFKTYTSLYTGVAAPIIQEGNLVSCIPCGSDLLEVYTNKSTAYPYYAGMKL